MFDDLMLPGYEENDAPIDGTNINQFILYFNDEDFAQMKQWCKDAMKKEFPADFHQRNASDIILLILKKYHNGNKEVSPEAQVDRGSRQ